MRGVLISFLHYGPVGGQSFCLGSKASRMEKRISQHLHGKGMGGGGEGRALHNGGMGHDVDG